MGMAGPEGFEPSFSGSEGQRLNPDWATGPQKRLVHKRLKVFRKSLKIVKGFIVVDVVDGPVAQHGWSVRLITERSPVQIRPGPLP